MKLQNNLLQRFADNKMLARLIVRGSTGGRVLTNMLFILSVIMFVLALARPQANPAVEKRLSTGLDIMILLDVSASMAAEDIQPSRLYKAKHLIRTLLNQLGGDRVGLLTFAGSAALVSPLTTDYQIIDSFLQTIDTSMIQNQGTNIGEAIDQSIAAIQRGSTTDGKSSAGSHILLIISDGEETDGKALAAANKARDAGALIYAIAIGTKRGAPIPSRNSQGELTGFKKDMAGETVISKVNGDALRKLAESGRGRFYFSTLGESEIADLVTSTKNLSRAEKSEITTKIYREYFMYPCGAGIILFFLSLLVRKKAVLLAFLMALTGSGTANAGVTKSLLEMFADAEYRQNKQAIEDLKEKRYDEAVNKFQRLQTDNPDSSELSYNVGSALIKSGQHEKGRKALRAVKDRNISAMADFNNAGSFLKEKKADQALLSYIDLIDRLEAKKNLTQVEKKVLDLARKNIELISRQQKGKNKSDQKNDKNQKNKNDQQNKNENDRQKQKDQKNESEKNQDSQNDDGKQGEQEKDQEDKSEKKQNQPPPRTNPDKKEQFKENKKLSKKDARQILKALEQREKRLQKKFLRKKAPKRSAGDRNLKDW